MNYGLIGILPAALLSAGAVRSAYAFELASPNGTMTQKATSTPAHFTDNLDEALAEAASTGKNVFACFSGSDWCGWCKKLEKEVLSKEEFVSSAGKDFVLVYIDSPSNKALLSKRARKHNRKLVEKYGIGGFPTALVLDKDGKELARTGYRKFTPSGYAAHLRAIVANREEIEAAKKEIERLEEKIEALEKGDRP